MYKDQCFPNLRFPGHKVLWSNYSSYAVPTFCHTHMHTRHARTHVHTHTHTHTHTHSHMTMTTYAFGALPTQHNNIIQKIVWVCTPCLHKANIGGCDKYMQ